VNIFSRRIVVGLTLFAALAAGGAHAQDMRVTPKGHWLAQELDRLDVETKWIAGAHVNWRTGLPDGVPETSPGRHTHCSAFVAAAAEEFGVYILRPPQYGQVLLANAQNEWLAIDGRFEGWRRLHGPAEAQEAANRGQLVVASYHNHHDNKPGHIAIVRPADKKAEDIAAEGPNVIQAGTINSASISLKAGFAGHTSAWNNNEIDYYAHALHNAGGPSPR
jgi:hypothetical protein